MALFMKVFGVNLIALRLHLVLMSGILVAVIYRMGKLLVSKEVGFYAALLFVFFFLNFAIEQASGYYHTDHNDVTFLFYVTLSIWSWLEYENSHGKRKLLFLILIGLFSGFAILTKWLVGLLVFGAWGVSVLFDSEKRKQPKAYLQMLISLGIKILVALPWQLYIIYKYPLKSAFEYSLNSKHFFEAIEKHHGTWTFHFDNSELLYGFPFIIIALSVFLLWKSIPNKSIRAGIISIIGVVYIFFSVASTKMPRFVFILAPLVLISIAVLVTYLFRLLIINPSVKKASLLTAIYHSVVILLLSFFTLNIEEIQAVHTS